MGTEWKLMCYHKMVVKSRRRSRNWCHRAPVKPHSSSMYKARASSTISTCTSRTTTTAAAMSPLRPKSKLKDSREPNLCNHRLRLKILKILTKADTLSNSLSLSVNDDDFATQACLFKETRLINQSS